MSELPEPYLKFGVLCERVLNEKDNVLSLIRLVDRFSVRAEGVKVPTDMPPGQVNLTIAMGWVGGLGKHQAQIRIIKPDGEEWKSNTMPLFLDSLERGQNFITHVTLPVKGEGLYWIEFLLNEVVKSRMPWRIVWQRVERPLQP